MSDIPTVWECEDHLPPAQTEPCPRCVLEAEIARLRAVVDAARTLAQRLDVHDALPLGVAREVVAARHAIRALDGEP